MILEAPPIVDDDLVILMVKAVTVDWDEIKASTPTSTAVLPEMLLWASINARPKAYRMADELSPDSAAITAAALEIRLTLAATSLSAATVALAS
jgi:hypothetical protein